MSGFGPALTEKLSGTFQCLHRDEPFEGEDIGLDLVRRIVKSHGERIWASSRGHQGATFYFFLPSRVSEAVEPEDVGLEIPLCSELSTRG